MTDRQCRECGITHIEAGMEIDGEPLCWFEDDLCSRCQDEQQASLERDAARYRFLRNRQTRQVDIAVGGLFVGMIPENRILGGEDLDRAIDNVLGHGLAEVEPLETRLAQCLAAIIDTPLLVGPDLMATRPIELRLGFFAPALSERAAELLEEAGL